MGAASVWIVPHIAEDIVDIIPVHKVTGERWKDKAYSPFEATLERTTRGMLDRDDPLISRFLECMWDTAVIRSYYASHFVHAASHAYRPLLKNISYIISGVRATLITNNVPKIIFYEKYWDFYIELRDALYNHETGWIVDILPYLFTTAITEDFDRFYEDIRGDFASTASRVGIRHYASSNKRLKALLRRLVRDHQAPIAYDIGRYIDAGDFDDVIVEWADNWTDYYVREAYTVLIGRGRYDLAKHFEARYAAMDGEHG